MRSKYIVMGIVVGVLLSLVVVVLAGQIDSPAGPTAAGGQMYTLEQIYDRLNDGTAATKMTAFTEPSSGPGSTMHTLNDIMGKAPAADNTNGATKAEVANGKKYWSLRTDGSGGSSWGLETGQLYGGCTCSGTLDGTRWCENGDGTVTDLTTCLVWLKKADWGGLKPWREEGDWTHNDDAHTRAGILYDGLPSGDADLSDGSVEGDWRLPTKTELYGLTHGAEAVLSGTPRAFTGVQSNYCWSSTTAASYRPSYAWYVYLNDGCVFSDAKASTYYVWPVRGGQ